MSKEPERSVLTRREREALCEQLEPERADELGAPNAVRFVGNAHARSAVWRISGARPWYVKRAASAGKFDAEVTALRTFAPHMDAATPQLVAPAPDARVFAMTSVGAGPVAWDEAPSVFERAGRALRSLRAAAESAGAPLDGNPPDPVPLPVAMQRRFEAWWPRAVPHLPPALRDAAVALWERHPPTETNRVPSHRDFSPRNWALAPDGTIGVFDFEHARYDHPLVDVLRLPEHGVPLSGARGRALLQGLGMAEAEDHPDYPPVAALHAISTVAWASEFDDAPFKAAGLRRLAEIAERFGDRARA